MTSRPFYETWRRLDTHEMPAESKVQTEVKPDLCDRCGFDWGVLKTIGYVGGTWPWCKLTPEASDFEKLQAHTLNHSFGNDAFEPYYDHHLPGGKEYGADYAGVKDWGHFIDSRSTRNRLMKEHNLVSGGKLAHKDRHSKAIDYDAVSEKIAHRAYKEWREKYSR